MPVLVAAGLNAHAFEEAVNQRRGKRTNPMLGASSPVRIGDSPAGVMDLSAFSSVDTTRSPKKLRGFYEKQNALLDTMQAHLKKHGHSYNLPAADAEAGGGEEKDKKGEDEEDNDNWFVQSAILLSFGCNVLLLGLKLWMAILTGSMSIIASAADSFLDLLSGLVLMVTERAAHENVDLYLYPEGRGRIEPIGVIIFATVMCLSSLNILIESVKVLVGGLIDKPPELEVGPLGFAVLGLTICLKLALYLWCKLVSAVMLLLAFPVLLFPACCPNPIPPLQRAACSPCFLFTVLDPP